MRLFRGDRRPRRRELSAGPGHSGRPGAGRPRLRHAAGDRLRCGSGWPRPGAGQPQGLAPFQLRRQALAVDRAVAGAQGGTVPAVVCSGPARPVRLSRTVGSGQTQPLVGLPGASGVAETGRQEAKAVVAGGGIPGGILLRVDGRADGGAGRDGRAALVSLPLADRTVFQADEIDPRLGGVAQANPTSPNPGRPIRGASPERRLPGRSRRSCRAST